jgi:integrase
MEYNMACFRKRERADGSFSYTAYLRYKRKGKIVYTESETFPKKKLAEVWAAKREAQLSELDALERAISGLESSSMTVGELIDRYFAEVFPLKPWGRSKTDTLKQIKNSEFGQLAASTVKASDIITHCRKWNERSSSSTTMQHYIYIKGVFGVATELLRCEVDYSQIDIAQRTMSKLGIISKAGSRDLRPTVEQMTKVVSLAHSRRLKWAESNKSRKDIIPMDKIIVFAMFSSRRQGEFSRMLRSNTDYERKRVLIPDMKHPTKKIGNDVWGLIPDEAWDVMLSMPVNENMPDNWFPYFYKTLGDRFRQLWKECGNYNPDGDNVRFHDLRHECPSWLFERDGLNGERWDVARVAGVTGHQSWESLKRYTQIESIEPNNKWVDWGWADNVRF